MPMYRTISAAFRRPLPMGNRWDGTTPTDTRSQRSRASRRGGQLLTRARSPLSKNGLPIRVPREPLSRTVTPYARREPPSQRNNTRALAVFHTGYKRYREPERPLPPRGPGSWALPERAVSNEDALPHHEKPGPQ